MILIGDSCLGITLLGCMLSKIANLVFKAVLCIFVDDFAALFVQKEIKWYAIICLIFNAIIIINLNNAISFVYNSDSDLQCYLLIFLFSLHAKWDSQNSNNS